MNLLEMIKRKLEKKKTDSFKEKPKKQTTHFLLDKYLTKAGLTIHTHLLSRGLFKMCLAINIIVTMYIVLFFAKAGHSLAYVIAIMGLVWVLLFFLVLAMIWLLFYLFLDFRIFKRKINIEDVLPDFLFLTATNIRSGMTIDRALWFAVRPRFGVLAREIETVAKEVMSGSELTDSLENFSKKYESDTLKRSINLLVEGIRSGGEIGELLTRIASNIQETKLMREEMASNVTTYVIFISFASIVAAPVLLALSNQLITIIGGIISKMDAPTTGNAVLALSSISVTPADFRIFAYFSIVITAFFSAIIIATIKKGNIKEGIKYIPIFISVGIVVFLIVSKIMETLMAGVFV